MAFDEIRRSVRRGIRGQSSQWHFLALASVVQPWLSLDARGRASLTPFAGAVKRRTVINSPDRLDHIEPQPEIPVISLYDVDDEPPALLYDLTLELTHPLDAKSLERVTLLHTALMLHVSTRVCSANDRLAPSDDR